MKNTKINNEKKEKSLKFMSKHSSKNLYNSSVHSQQQSSHIFKEEKKNFQPISNTNKVKTCVKKRNRRELSVQKNESTLFKANMK